MERNPPADGRGIGLALRGVPSQTPPASTLRLTSLMNTAHGIPPPRCQIKRSCTRRCGAAGHVMERGPGARGRASSLGVAEKPPPSTCSSVGPRATTSTGRDAQKSHPRFQAPQRKEWNGRRRAGARPWQGQLHFPEVSVPLPSAWHAASAPHGPVPNPQSPSAHRSSKNRSFTAARPHT